MINKVLFGISVIGLCLTTTPVHSNANTANGGLPESASLHTPINDEAVSSARSIGSLEIWHPDFHQIIAPETHLEHLADGFTWSEGPAWDEKRQQLYFSDVPENKAYVWSERSGLNVFLDPSGIAAAGAAGFREPGSNGLLALPNDQLLIANHGKRALELMDLKTKQREVLVSTYEGKKLNSPNDVTRAKDGTLFFTDPPYGLAGDDSSPLKELSFNGIYRLGTDGALSVIDDTQTRPNGIALSPDENSLYVAVSDPDRPVIMKYTKDNMGLFTNGTVWFDASDYLAQGLAGLPDGMAVASNGYVFATGPGGVFVLTPQGIAVGQIRTGQATANCTFGDDGKTLYITAGNTLARIKLLVGADY